jgi:hypothetical protein
MIKFLNYLLLIFRKIFDLLTSLPFLNAIRSFTDRNVLFPILFVCIFFNTFLNFFIFLKDLQWNKINIENIKNEISSYIFNFSSQKSNFDPLILFFFFICFVVIFDGIIAIKKKKKTDEDIVPMRERLFAILPYLWFLIEMTYGMLDSFTVFIKLVAPENQVDFITYDLVAPCISAYLNIPFIKLGFISNFIYYFNYFYVGRNDEKFSFFVRYFYIQCLAISSLFTLVMHIYFLALKYGLRLDPVLRQFFGLNIYALFLTSVSIIIIFILLGKESMIPGIHPSILYHVGIKKKRKKK